MPVDTTPKIGPLPILDLLQTTIPASPSDGGAFSRELSKTPASSADQTKASGSQGNSSSNDQRNSQAATNSIDRSSTSSDSKANRSSQGRQNSQQRADRSRDAADAKNDAQPVDRSSDRTTADQAESNRVKGNTADETNCDDGEAVAVSEEATAEEEEITVAAVDASLLPVVVPIPVVQPIEDAPVAATEEPAAITQVAIAAQVNPSASAIAAVDVTAASATPVTEAIAGIEVDPGNPDQEVYPAAIATTQPEEDSPVPDSTEPVSSISELPIEAVTEQAKPVSAEQHDDQSSDSDNEAAAQNPEATTAKNAKVPTDQGQSSVNDAATQPSATEASIHNAPNSAPQLAPVAVAAAIDSAANAATDKLSDNSTKSDTPAVEAKAPVSGANSTSPSRFNPAPNASPAKHTARTTANQVDTTRLLQRVSRAFAAAEARGGDIRLRLSPPELGSLHLQISVNAGVVTARVETETAAARTILLENLPQLREQLAEQGMKIEQFDVNVASQGSGGGFDSTPGGAERENREQAWRQQVPSARPTGKDASAQRRSDGQWDDDQLNVLV